MGKVPNQAKERAAVLGFPARVERLCFGLPGRKPTANRGLNDLISRDQRLNLVPKKQTAGGRNSIRRVGIHQ